MPNGNGWANEPMNVIEGITALEIEARSIEAEEAEEMSTNGNRASSNTVRS